MALQVINQKSDPITIHQKTLARFKELWLKIYDNTSCFSCLSRAPEDTLDCHHSLCTQCTRTHGTSTLQEPWTFYVAICPLCCERNYTTFAHKPDTAGIRAIIAEGGGVRGIIPLAFLKELQAVIDLPIAIQEHFDIAVGSSSGKSTNNRWRFGRANTVQVH